MEHTAHPPTEATPWTVERVPNDLPPARALAALAALAPAPARVARGAARIAWHAAAWLTDADGRAEVRSLTGRDATALRLDAIAQHRRDMLTRAQWVALPALVVLAATAVVLTRGPWVWRVVVVLAATALAWAAGAPALDALDDDEGAPADARGRGDVVADALAAAVPKVDADEVRVASPARDIARGWVVDVVLPPGIAARDALRQHDRVAGALRVPADALVLTPGTRSAAHLAVAVLDGPLRTQRATPSPYLDAPTVDVFDGLVLGETATGAPVRVPLVGAHGILGAQPRVGKTAALRHLLVAASLDPRVELHVHGWKGGRDLDPLADVAAYYRAGDAPDDYAAALADLEHLVARMRARYATMATLTDAQCPDGQTSTALADDPALDLWPILLAWDETQEPYSHREHGARLAQLVEDLVRRGPAVGVIVWQATQRPDATSLPPAIAANASTRWCMAVDTWQASDMTLGTGMHQRGVSATTLTTADKGIGWLRAPARPPAVVRSYYLDLPASRRVVARAAARRAEAAHPTPAVDVDDVRARLRAAWPATRHGQPVTGMWLPDIAAALHLPEHAVADALAASGLAVEAVALYQPATPGAKAGTRRRPGITWRQLDDADTPTAEVLPLARGAA